MTIFDVIRYSPLSVTEEMCERLPFPVLKQWFEECYDGHLVMFDIEDTNNKEFRNDTNMKSKVDRTWFIDSLGMKKCEREAIILLTRILMELE